MERTPKTNEILV